MKTSEDKPSERTKWMQEVRWRNAEIAIKTEEMQLKRNEPRDRRIAVFVSVIAATFVLLASIVTSCTTLANAEKAAEATNRLADKRYRLEILDDQRRVTTAAVLTFGRELTAGIDHLQTLTSGFAHFERKFDRVEIASWETKNRQHVQAVNNAALAVFVVSESLANKFDPIHKLYASIDEDIYRALQRGSGGATKEEWVALNARLLSIKLAPTIAKALPEIRRPDVSASGTNGADPRLERQSCSRVAPGGSKAQQSELAEFKEPTVMLTVQPLVEVTLCSRSLRDSNTHLVGMQQAEYGLFRADYLARRGGI